MVDAVGCCGRGDFPGKEFVLLYICRTFMLDLVRTSSMGCKGRKVFSHLVLPKIKFSHLDAGSPVSLAVISEEGER